jgi:hypothetical protein
VIRRAAAVAASLSLTIALALRANLWTQGTFAFSTPADHHKYLYMATHGPLSFHLAAYGWRPGLPLLIRLSPFNAQWSFFAIAFLSIWLVGIVIHRWLLALQFSELFALSGVFLFYSLYWATRWPLSDFWLPDALLFLVVAALLWCLARGRDLWFAILLAAGVAIKESALFVAPLYYTLQKTSLKKLCMVLMPALVMFFALRIGIPQWNRDAAYVASLPAEVAQSGAGTPSGAYDYIELIKEVGWHHLRQVTFWQLTVGSFGLLALLPLLSLRKETLLSWLPFVLLVYCQLLFAVDTERLLVLAFPALIVLSLNGLKRFPERYVIAGCFALAIVNLIAD